MNRSIVFRLYGVPACALVLLSAVTMLLSGCGNFFSCEGKASCPTTTTTGTGPTLTALAGSPYPAPTSVGALAMDSTNAYLIASGYSSSTGIQLYSIGAAGALASSEATGTGTLPSLAPTAIAATHPLTGAGSSADYVYVANSATGPTYLNGYNLAGGTLAAATGAPFSLGYSPTSMAITPANTFLYVASDSALTAGVGYIYGYSIGTGGALSILDSGTPLVSESVSSLAISPDGDWLFCLDTDGITLEEYAIDTSTGALTFAATYGVTGTSNTVVTPSSVTVAPSGEYFVAALGQGGANTFSFVTSTGVGTPSTGINPANTLTGIYAIAIDSNNYLYCAGTAGLQVFSVTAAGVPTLLKTYTTGIGAHSIAINRTSTAVYVGNQTDGTITGYAISTN
jgi:6-phosphogluconolactonase (cycloisomerase 2 family)